MHILSFIRGELHDNGDYTKEESRSLGVFFLSGKDGTTSVHGNICGHNYIYNRSTGNMLDHVKLNTALEM